MSDIMNEYADLVAEVTRLKAELEECKSPIMTHDQKISYWEDEHKKTLADCDRYRALFEKMRARLEAAERNALVNFAIASGLRRSKMAIKILALVLFFALGIGFWKWVVTKPEPKPTWGYERMINDAACIEAHQNRPDYCR